MEKICIIDQTRKVNIAELQALATALELQITRDVLPIWGVSAKVVYSISELEGHWPMYIVDALDLQNAYGYHYLSDDKIPYAKVLYRPNYSLTMSHELIEMLINPYLERFQKTDIDPTKQGDETFLVEIAGPVQDINYSYVIDKFRVSDFLYPAYFDFLKIEGKQYDHKGYIVEPRSLLNGGYVSYTDQLGIWWQAFKTQNVIDYRKLSTGKIDNALINRILRFVGVLGGAIALLFIIKKLIKR